MALKTRYIASMASLALVAGSLVAAGGATAAFAAEPVAGGQTTGDVLFPNQGNTGYDALHYDLDFVVDVAVSGTANAVSSTSFREATATIDARTTDAPLSEYSFDFQGSTGNLAAATLNVDSVKVNGVPATFTRIENTTASNATTDKHKLIVTPATPVEGNFTTEVKYSGKPVSHTDTDGSSEGWNNTTDGATFLNQPVGAMTAFPNNNTPSDKATYDISIDIPSKLKTSATAAASSPGLRDAAAVSNGELVSKTPSADGSRTKWVWEQTKPMGSFLAMISIGRYDTYESDITLSNSGRTIHEWTFIDPAISQANQNTTLATRQQLPQILNFLESKFGPYPGNSTGLVVDVVPGGINYALETQDRSFFPTAASRSTTIHELMHQWYGDSVSPTVWNDIWISEGSATYSEAQTAYESAGSTTTNTESSYFTTWNSSSSTSSMWTTPTAGMTLASQLFGSQVYTRGAMTLEALRTVIGTEDFATLMNEWQLRNAGTSKRTADFIALAEEVSGRNLTAFFQSWLYGNTKAAWPAKFNVTLAGPAATVSSGDTASYTLTNRNTGKVPQNGTVISVDASGILDKAALGTLPTGLTLNGTTLSWAVPSTATSASQSVTFTAVPNADTAGQTLTATVSDATLGQTCVECSSSTVIAAQPLSPTATPTVTGGTTVGSTLTAVTDGWAEGTTFGYQWLVDGTPVPGATASTYTVTGFDAGFGVSVKVTGSKAGSNAVVSTSAATAVITRAALTVGTPTITGSAQFGKPLTVNPGNWTPGTYFTYQWTANGASVTAANGGTGPQFIPAVVTQLGQTIAVTTTGTKFGYTTQGATSGATAPVEGGVFESTPTPLITGTPRALSALTVDQGAWDRFTTLTNQWYVDGTPVSGSAGTGLTFTPTVAQIGGKVTVTVTGTKAGYPTTAKTSAETAAIGNPVQVLTPTPTIGGTVKVDSTLTVTPGTWDSGTTLAYQWFADDTVIEGATGTTLLLTPELAGAVVTVKVTSTKSGYEDASKTSAATEKVEKGDLSNIPTPTIEGTPKVAVELTAVPGTWDDGVELSYQWSVGGDEVSGATAATFTPRGADAGKPVTVTVTGTKPGYSTTSMISEPTADVAEGTLTTTPTPTITGTAKVGVQLTAVPGTWDSGTAFAYQWSVDGEAIEGATSATYTPGASRLGKTLTVAVTGTKEGYGPVTKTSAATAAVIAGDLTPAPNPTISGTAKVGVQLTAVPGTWAADTVLTYQWSVGGVAVTDATGTTYTPVVADAAKTVTVAVTGTKTGYTTVTRTSSATSAVAVGDLGSAPVPTISGTPKVGVVLTADAGTWDSGTTLKYQWNVAGSLVPGANSVTFTPAPSALGKAVTVSVTGTKTGYATVTRTSTATENVVRGDLITTPTPTIDGTPKVDAPLTAIAGTWDSVTVLTFQWSVDGTAVEGATSALFTPGADAAGKTITVSVTGTKPGYSPVTTTSEPTDEVEAGDLVATPIPTIEGTPKVDVELSAVTGEWDENVEFSYQWLVAGVEIEGATESTFVPAADAAGEAVTVSVTGAKDGYTAVTVTSEPTQNVSVGDLVSTSVPTFSGKVQVASIVKAVAGDWDSGVTLSYQWLRNGVSITGATKSSYKVAPADFGRTLSVVVSGSKPGYLTVAERATASKVIAGVQVHQPKPVIKGTAKVGRTLSVKKALYDSSVTLTYAWFSDGRKVSSKKTLTLGSSLKGTRITVTVTAKKTGYATVAKTSSKTATVKKK